MKSQYVAGARTLCPNSPALAKPDQQALTPLPAGGVSRFKKIKPYLPVSRETWRLMGKAGRAPQPHRLGERCTVWRNDEVNAWLANPAAFVAEG